MYRVHNRILIVVAAVALLAAACTKKTAAVKTPPPPAATAPVAAPHSAPAQQVAAAKPAPQTTVTKPKYPNAETRARIDQLLARIEDAYFDFNKSTIRPDALKALQDDTATLRDILKDYPDYKLTVEGHCDERGSAEYNLGLGDRRAQATKEYLVTAGIPSAQLAVVSYGKERPVCQEHDEACWQRNRRTHIVAMAQVQQTH